MFDDNYYNIENENEYLREHFPYIVRFLRNDPNINIYTIAKRDIDNRINGYLAISNTITGDSCHSTIVCDTHDTRGNFFIETDDYDNIDNDTLGWYPQCNCELMIYYFFSSRQLYVINKNAFDQLLNSNLNNLTKIHSQNKKHNTAGYLVPRRQAEDSLNENDLCLYNIDYIYTNQQYNNTINISRHFIR